MSSCLFLTFSVSLTSLYLHALPLLLGILNL